MNPELAAVRDDEARDTLFGSAAGGIQSSAWKGNFPLSPPFSHKAPRSSNGIVMSPKRNGAGLGGKPAPGLGDERRRYLYPPRADGEED